MFNGLNPLQVIIRKKTMVTQVAAVLPFTSVSPIAPQNYSKYKNRFNNFFFFLRFSAASIFSPYFWNLSLFWNLIEECWHIEICIRIASDEMGTDSRNSSFFRNTYSSLFLVLFEKKCSDGCDAPAPHQLSQVHISNFYFDFLWKKWNKWSHEQQQHHHQQHRRRHLLTWSHLCCRLEWRCDICSRDPLICMDAITGPRHWN